MPIFGEFTSLSSKLFKLFAHFCNPILGSLAIFSFTIWKRFASLCIFIKTRFPIIYKMLYKKGITCLMTSDFDVFNLSDIKHRVHIKRILLRELSAGRKHLWVSIIPNFKIPHCQVKIMFSHYEITIPKKASSFAIFDSAILSDFVRFASSNLSICLPAHNLYPCGSWC